MSDVTGDDYVISTNPLRYPGGKHYLADYVALILESNDLEGCTLYEPYAGSAAVSLEMLKRGRIDKTVLVERDPLLYSFWNAVVTCPEMLCDEVRRLDISLETWHRFLRLREAKTPLEYPLLPMAIAGLFYNRTNFSGILHANPIGGKSQSSAYPIDCRFSKPTVISHIEQISNYQDRITVKWADAVSFMTSNLQDLGRGHCFLYADPPYYEQGRELYRYHYNDEQHEELASFLKRACFPWLLSYDDHQFIRDLYSSQAEDFISRHLYLDYTAQKRKRGRELLISNLEIPPVVREMARTVRADA